MLLCGQVFTFSRIPALSQVPFFGVGDIQTEEIRSPFSGEV